MALLPTGVFLLYFRVAELFVVSFGLVVWMCFTWIPYFTGRRTTAGVMIMSLGSKDYQAQVVTMSHAAERLETDNGALETLSALGVNYVYVGQKGDFSGPGLDVARLIQAENLTLVYQDAGVSVLQIQPLN